MLLAFKLIFTPGLSASNVARASILKVLTNASTSSGKLDAVAVCAGGGSDALGGGSGLDLGEPAEDPDDPEALGFLGLFGICSSRVSSIVSLTCFVEEGGSGISTEGDFSCLKTFSHT